MQGRDDPQTRRIEVWRVIFALHVAPSYLLGVGTIDCMGRVSNELGAVRYDGVPSMEPVAHDMTEDEGTGLVKAGGSEVKIGTLGATAICGNDLMSSCLYTTGHLSRPCLSLTE